MRRRTPTCVKRLSERARDLLEKYDGDLLKASMDITTAIYKLLKEGNNPETLLLLYDAIERLRSIVDRRRKTKPSLSSFGPEEGRK